MWHLCKKVWVPVGALFTVDGDGFVPSDFTRGPWRADAQHGGPSAALLVRAIEELVGDRELVSQFEIELTKPVPLQRLTVEAERVDVSARVSRVRAGLYADGEAVASATALVLAMSELGPPDWVREEVVAALAPAEVIESGGPRYASRGLTTFHRNAVQHELRRGSFKDAGPALDWIRLRLPVVDGERTSPLQRLAALADFGSGISSVYAVGSPSGLINTNLVVAIHRAPIGEWISLDATSYLGEGGTGLAVTAIGDVRGGIGVATQCLLGHQGRSSDVPAKTEGSPSA